MLVWKAGKNEGINKSKRNYLGYGILNSMQKSIKSFFAFPLIFSFLFSSIICCCQFNHAEAGISHQEATENTLVPSHNHCDSDDSKDHNSSGDHKCECPKILGILAKNVDILKSAEIIPHFLNHQIILDKIFLAFASGNHNSLIGPSPPHFSTSTGPLYIKNPTLRI